VHINLNTFCTAIVLKIEDCEEVMSYMQDHRHTSTRRAAAGLQPTTPPPPQIEI
jgi:hypothetical protein